MTAASAPFPVKAAIVPATAKPARPQRRSRFDVACTIEVEHTAESLHAHIALEGEPPLGPGDRVQVHGAPIKVAFGGRLLERRVATITRAGWLRRRWTRLAAWMLLTELYEVSFTPRRAL